MDVIVLIGRILFVLLFLGSGLGHLTKLDAMAGYVQMRGVPASKPATAISGLWILAGALSVALGVYADLGALMLAGFTLVAAFLVHHFWTDTDPQMKTMEQTQFLKDLALTGAGLILFGLYAGYGAGLGLTITGPLFGG